MSIYLSDSLSDSRSVAANHAGFWGRRRRFESYREYAPAEHGRFMHLFCKQDFAGSNPAAGFPAFAGRLYNVCSAFWLPMKHLGMLVYRAGGEYGLRVIYTHEAKVLSGSRPFV